ncbi:MAG: hypothetical protein AAFO94_17630, partial [Bacteroidota bacterium]
SLLLLSACKKENTETPVERRDVTNLTLTLVTPGMIDPLIFSYDDPDGIGGDAPVVTGGTLQSNQVYFASAEVLNKTVDPTEDITEEIKQNPSEFQFFYIADNLSFSTEYTDQDENGNPVGLVTALLTDGPGEGKIILNLTIGLNKSAEGVPDGNIANAGGSTLLQASFPVLIE